MENNEFELKLKCKKRGWDYNEVHNTFMWIMGKLFELKTRGLVGTAIKLTEKGRVEYRALTIAGFVPKQEIVLELLSDGLAPSGQEKQIYEFMMSE